MNLVERVLAIREGGQTQRCHTMQYIGPYNIAIHSYNALSLLLLLHSPGVPSLNLIKAVQWHDVPERWTGDVPTPAKLSCFTFRSTLGGLERRILLELELDNLFISLTPEEENWLHAVDLLELFIWGREQYEMGNKTVDKMNSQIMKIFKNKWSSIPLPVQQFVERFKWSRSLECNELIGAQNG